MPKADTASTKPFYKGQRVAYMERKGELLILTMTNTEKTKGKPRPKIEVSQKEWDEHGEYKPS